MKSAKEIISHLKNDPLYRKLRDRHEFLSLFDKKDRDFNFLCPFLFLLFLFKFFCNSLKQLSYFKLLRADAFTFSAFDAIGCLCGILSVYLIVKITVPGFKLLFLVIAIKKRGDLYLFRTF